MRSGTRIIAALVAAACGTGTAWSQLYLVEPREGGYTSTRGYDLSDDGTTLVGASIGSSVNGWGYRYSVGAGRQDFALDSHTPFVTSANGSRTGGVYIDTRPGMLDAFLFRESSHGSIEYVAHTLPLIAAMNAAGTAMTGYEQLEGGRRRAVVWDEASGYRPLQHFTQSVFSSEARDMSSDGRTIVGDFNLDLVQFPMVWREETGMIPLPLPSPGYEGFAGAVSPDGRTVVGKIGQLANDDRITIWAQGGEPTRFAQLSSSENPMAITDWGLVAGEGIPSRGGAWVWSEEMGKTSLRAYAAQFGVTFDTSLYLRTCEAISADGRVFAGEAVLPDRSVRGYMLVVPAPGAGAWFALSGLAIAGSRARRR